MPHDPSLPIQERPDYQGIIHTYPAASDSGILSAGLVYPVFYCEKDTTIDVATFSVADYLVPAQTLFVYLYYNTTLEETGATTIASFETTSKSNADSIDFDLTPTDSSTVNNRVPAGNTIFLIGYDSDPT